MLKATPREVVNSSTSVLVGKPVEELDPGGCPALPSKILAMTMTRWNSIPHGSSQLRSYIGIGIGFCSIIRFYNNDRILTALLPVLHVNLLDYHMCDYKCAYPTEC